MSSKNEDLHSRMKRLTEEQSHQDVKPSSSHPQGWAPGVEWKGDSGVLTSDTLEKLPETPSDWDEIFSARGLNLDIYEIASDTIKWTSYDGWKRDAPGEEAYSTLCFSVKADIRLKNPFVETADYDALYKEAKKAKPPKDVDGDTTFVVNLSDWQIGNADGGGVEAQVIALAGLSEKLIQRIKDLRKMGRKIDTIAIAGLGDLFENCEGFYEHQRFTVELNRRQQETLIRMALFDIIKALAPMAPKVIVFAIGGNHGENRGSKNRYVTDKSDNADVAVFEQVRDICSANPEAFGHIDWRIPTFELAIAVELSGQYVAITHGHIGNFRTTALNTMWTWWEKQAMGRFYPGVAQADILICGHYHHFNVKEQLGRTVFIAPSLTDVSDYFGDKNGVMTSPGTLTMTISESGWDDVQIVK